MICECEVAADPSSSPAMWGLKTEVEPRCGSVGCWCFFLCCSLTICMCIVYLTCACVLGALCSGRGLGAFLEAEHMRDGRFISGEKKRGASIHWEGWRGESCAYDVVACIPSATRRATLSHQRNQISDTLAGDFFKARIWGGGRGAPGAIPGANIICGCGAAICICWALMRCCCCCVANCGCCRTT